MLRLMMILTLRLFFLLCMHNTPLAAQNPIVELESTFKGNQEQPKVLYIVPWKKIAAPEAYYQPLESLIEDSFELLDRDEFKRKLRFKQKLKNHSIN